MTITWRHSKDLVTDQLTVLLIQLGPHWVYKPMRLYFTLPNKGYVLCVVY